MSVIGLFVGIVDFFLGFVIGAFTGAIGNDFYARALPLAASLVEAAVIRLPAQKRDQFRADSLAELDQLQGNVTKLCHALGCFLFSINPRLNLLRVSRWRSIRKTDDSIRSAVDSFGKSIMLFVLFAAVGVIETTIFEMWVSLVFVLLPLWLTIAIWSDWKKDFTKLIVGEVVFTVLPNCPGVSVALETRAIGGDKEAQSHIARIFERQARGEAGLDRVIHFHAAEFWLRRAARAGDQVAREVLIAHLRKCRKYLEAQIWECMPRVEARPV
jgi:hypothetical protein